MPERRSHDILAFETGEASPTAKPMPAVPWDDLDAASPRALSGPAAPSNLPRRRCFVEREAELCAAEGALGKEAAMVTLHGLAGSGKTAIALEAAHRATIKRAYPGGVWWLSAGGAPAEALARLAPSARVLGDASLRAALAALPPEASLAEVGFAMRLGLQARRGAALLVLDGIDSAGWPAHLPGGDVRVLATARDARIALGTCVRVGPLALPDARELARVIAGDPGSDAEALALERVLKVGVGGLAAAVEQAARAVVRWAQSWIDYERHMYSDLRALLEERDPQSDYPESVLTAIDRSIDDCERGSTERRLLEGAAVFAPDEVPIPWAARAAGLDASHLDTKRAIAALRGLGLFTVRDEARTVSLDCLIHRRVRERAEPDDLREANQLGAACVASWLEDKVDQTRTLEVEARRAQIEEALAAADRGGDALVWLRIADRLGAHLRHLALYTEARSVLERAVSRAETLEPLDPARLADCLTSLASLLKDLGQPADARAHMERALSIDEQLHGPDHPSVARDLLSLAGVLKDLGRSADAKPLLERALSIDEKTHGPSHPSTAKTLATLATVLKDLGQPAEARVHLERALAIDEAAFGRDHPSAVVRLTNLAMVLKDMGQASEARPLLQRALMILEGAYGGEHPIVASSLTNLAVVLRELGQVAEAMPLLARAHRIAEKALPANHPTRQKIAAHLAASATPPSRGNRAGA